MILLITHKTDYTADFVVNHLNKMRIPYRRLNCEDLFMSDFSLRFEADFRYSILGEDDYKSVWFRRTKLPEIKNLSGEETAYVAGEVEFFFKNLFSILPAKWLSPPSAVYEAENKLLQLKWAQKLGFTIPETLITNSETTLKTFYKANNQNIIVKPIYQSRISYREDSAFIFTNRVSQNLMDQIEKFDLTPCIFQKNIPKDYEIRATVIGEKVFAAAVYSQADIETKVDWRRKRLAFVETFLPAEIENLCVRLLKELNLGFGAIDLIKTPEGEYVFLEINPNGQWAWIENQTGQKISDAIIKYLSDE